MVKCVFQVDLAVPGVLRYTAAQVAVVPRCINPGFGDCIELYIVDARSQTAVLLGYEQNWAGVSGCRGSNPFVGDGSLKPFGKSLLFFRGEPGRLSIVTRDLRQLDTYFTSLHTEVKRGWHRLSRTKV